MNEPNWQAVIGLEIHMQLCTRSKLFSGAEVSYGGGPNTRACEIDVALPGVLPVLNEDALRMAIAFGLAVNAKIAPITVFARKNYFYPDLPKGYQISQYESPVVCGGSVPVRLADGSCREILLERAHLEEDAGKLIHDSSGKTSYVDLNRAGTTLIEIVSKPVISSAAEAIAYMKQIHAIGCYLEICDGNMQEGSMRCDANVSIKRSSDSVLGVRTEIKNLNSFRFVEKAIRYEIKRQIEVLEEGGRVNQETRLYDSERDETRVLRSKEEAEDYRYFPEPDLLPVQISSELIAQVRAQLPELQHLRRERFINDYALGEQDAEQLTQSKAIADYFESCLKMTELEPKLIANWMMTQLNALLNRDGLDISQAPVQPERLVALIERVADHTISAKSAKEVLATMWNDTRTAEQIIEAKGLKQISDTSQLDAIVEQILNNNPKQVAQFLSGKDKVLGYFVGQAMKASQGQADPAQLSQCFKTRLEKLKN